MKVSDALFNPANMTVNVKNRKPEKKPVTNVAPVSKGDVTAEDYINHISYKKFIAIVREKNIPFGV